ncbi:MAG: hypothetical protein ACOZF2_02265 [Thermodesulfobacteriota bacterium]
MKIEDILSLALNPARPEAKPTEEGEANFAQHLQEALTASSKAATGNQAPLGLEQLAALSRVSEVGDTPGEVLETVLTHLDKYQQALAQADLPLKQVADLVQTLAQDSQRLQSLAQNLPGNSPLKQVMEEAAALAYTESFKFNRGDYV